MLHLLADPVGEIVNLRIEVSWGSSKIENAPENGKHNFGSPEISKKL
jgi:hypothetical protein